MNRQCPTLKRNGDRCSGSVPEGKYHCWFHDPANSDKRRRAASRGGKGNRSKLSRDLHVLLEDLTNQVVSGELEPYPASVAGSLIGVRLRLLECERRLKEIDELAAQVAELTERFGA
ncbi:MAG: hypothetical protein LC740_12700 [Actinobacteria bacterium]|nr:hypothetical protein [Actinomycetota bacterium]